MSYPSYYTPHMTAVRVTPAIAIATSSVANPTILETEEPHQLVTGDTVDVLGHTGSTPAVEGEHVVTVIDATHVSVPVHVTIAGAGGTLTRALAVDPLTLADGKLVAGLEWADGDARETLLRRWLAQARSQVQQDTGVVPLLETYDVYFDALPSDSTPIRLPWRPVVSVVSVSAIDPDDVLEALDDVNYHLDPGSDSPMPARVGLSDVGAWPTDLRSFQPYVLRIVVGYPSVARVPPWFAHAMGLLTAHYATVGRDLTTVGTIIEETPQGYRDVIAPYQLVVVP